MTNFAEIPKTNRVKSSKSLGNIVRYFLRGAQTLLYSKSKFQKALRHSCCAQIPNRTTAGILQRTRGVSDEFYKKKNSRRKSLESSRRNSWLNHRKTFRGTPKGNSGEIPEGTPGGVSERVSGGISENNLGIVPLGNSEESKELLQQFRQKILGDSQRLLLDEILEDVLIKTQNKFLMNSGSCWNSWKNSRRNF